jgi:tryptophan-rich sensory protein
MFTRFPHLRLIASLAICLAVGYIDLLFFLPGIPAFYNALVKPSYVPGVTILYYGIIAISLLLGLAMYLIWNMAVTSKDARLDLYLFLCGLVLNVLWFFAFFRIQSLFIALIVMAVFLAVMLATFYQAIRSAVLAALVLLPYCLILLAVTYANFMIYILNPTIPFLKLF